MEWKETTDRIRKAELAALFGNLGSNLEYWEMGMWNETAYGCGASLNY